MANCSSLFNAGNRMFHVFLQQMIPWSTFSLFSGSQYLFWAFNRRLFTPTSTGTAAVSTDLLDAAHHGPLTVVGRNP